MTKVMKKGDRVLALEGNRWDGSARLYDGKFVPFGSWRGYVEYTDGAGRERKEGPFPLEWFMPYSQDAAERLAPLLARNAGCVKNLSQSNAEVQAAFKALRKV